MAIYRMHEHVLNKNIFGTVRHQSPVERYSQTYIQEPKLQLCLCKYPHYIKCIDHEKMK